MLAVLGVGIGIAVVTVMSLPRRGSQAYATSTGAATVTAAELNAFPAGVGALGRIDPVSRVRRLAPPSSVAVNRVDRLLVSEGDTVAAGQVLAELADAPERRAAQEESDALVAEAETQLARVKAATRFEDIAAQREHVSGLQQQAAMAREDATRAGALVPAGAGARAVADRAETAATRALAELREAQAKLASMASARPEDVMVAEAKVRSARAAAGRAREAVGLSQIRAPIDGTILKIHARAGDMAGPEGILELANLDRIEIVAAVYETDLSRVRAGAEAEVSVPGTTARYPAKVREIGRLVRREMQADTNPTAAVDARTVEVRLSLDPTGSHALGERINARVHVAIRP